MTLTDAAIGNAVFTEVNPCRNKKPIARNWRLRRAISDNSSRGRKVKKRRESNDSIGSLKNNGREHGKENKRLESASDGILFTENRPVVPAADAAFDGGLPGQKSGKLMKQPAERRVASQDDEPQRKRRVDYAADYRLALFILRVSPLGLSFRLPYFAFPVSTPPNRRLRFWNAAIASLSVSGVKSGHRTLVNHSSA